LFLTIGGAGTGNATDYFNDVSYGSISFASSRVYGWYQAPFSSTNTLGRADRVQQCANSVSPADLPNIDFNYYWGIIMVTNAIQDGGACGVGRITMTIFGQQYPLGCVVFDPASMYTAYAPQEIGHGLGMYHSWDTTPCEYCDPYDQMSGVPTWQFNNPNYPPYVAETGTTPGFQSGGAGPGINLPNALFLGVIPNDRLSTYQVGSPTLIYVLGALSHPTAGTSLGVRIVGADPNDIYTVEYRQTDGWDAGLPENAVMIHEYKKGATPYSYLQEGPSGTNGQWTAGTTWQNSSLGVSVHVVSIDPAQGTATVSVSP
jgi:hypothetical protein